MKQILRGGKTYKNDALLKAQIIRGKAPQGPNKSSIAGPSKALSFVIGI